MANVGFPDATICFRENVLNMTGTPLTDGRDCTLEKRAARKELKALFHLGRMPHWSFDVPLEAWDQTSLTSWKHEQQV